MAVQKHNFENIGKSWLHTALNMRFACLIILALLTFFVQIGTVGATVIGTCVKVDSCTCKFDDGSGVISLSTLASQDGPRFNFTKGTIGPFLYAYNPCKPFSWHPQCQNVAACQSSLDGKGIFNIGTQDSAMFDSTGSFITYSATEGALRQTTVTLVCDSSATEPVLEVKGEESQDHYAMTLTSNCACKNGCNKSSGRISFGSVLCILFSVGVVLYLVGGVLFLKFVKGAEGKELIPNYDFWIDLPMLIKDGVLFLASGCKSDSSYDQI